ncbi:MAG: hypothetical protein WDN69_21755 [Aliidongia sp.]
MASASSAATSASGPWFGHSGGFPGYVTRTATIPTQDLTISILTNDNEGLADGWTDGAVHILQSFAKNGAPTGELAEWSGRWWVGPWGAFDLLPMADKVLVAAPGRANPVAGASEIEMTGRDEGLIALAGSFANYREPVRLERAEDGSIAAIHLGAMRLQPEDAIISEFAPRER